MKILKKAMTVAVALMLPLVAEAQVNLTSLVASTSGPGRIAAGTNPSNGGGRFNAVIAGPTLAPNPQNALIYCIEGDRFFTNGTNYTNYKMFTFTEFLALDYRGANTIGNLNQMVVNAGIIDGGVGKNAAQDNTWAIMSGAFDLATVTDNSGWFVLSNAVKSTNAQGVVTWSGNQTFLAKVTTVPEPSSFAVVTIALAGMGFVARRRQSRDA